MSSVWVCVVFSLVVSMQASAFESAMYGPADTTARGAASTDAVLAN